ncbi:histamine H2 receptor-like [Oculina patagonica]
MTNSFCYLLLRYQPSSSEAADLYSSYIANCVFNAFSSYTAIMLNIVTIRAIRKTSSLPKPLKTLLLSLAVSDLGVGLLGQPFYVVLMVWWLQGNYPNCAAYTTYTLITMVFSLASFFGVTAISVDRFLAIHLHLRYQELVTHKRVVAVVISIWVISVFISTFALWTPTNVTDITFTIIDISCLVAISLLNYKVYLVVRRHTNEMQALQVQHVALANVAASVRKSAVGMLYVYLAFLVCYLPQICSFIVSATSGPMTAMKGLVVYSWTLMFLNSSLNPVIYCWKMRHIRHAIMDMLGNMLPRHDLIETLQLN